MSLKYALLGVKTWVLFSQSIPKYDGVSNGTGILRLKLELFLVLSNAVVVVIIILFVYPSIVRILLVVSCNGSFSLLNFDILSLD